MPKFGFAASSKASASPFKLRFCVKGHCKDKNDTIFS